ncbi:MAG TPA: TonB family protein [Bryobacteraceae bacterium]|nr:TonB family protein [Bryobacteraceae bacterium]
MNEAMWFGFLTGVALKSTAVLGVAWLGSLFLRGRSAASRHLVWTAAAVAVLALPLFSVSVPALRVPSFARLAPGIAVFFETTAKVETQATSSASAGFAATLPAHSESGLRDWRLALMLAWGIGAAAILAQMLLAYVLLFRLRRRSQPSPDDGLAAPLVRQLGISRHVAILETEENSMPMACGLLQPAILMPAGARNWTAERRRMVLLHELAHVKRGDVATHLLARLSMMLNWWNPLAWVAWRESLKECERAADDLVLGSGARASDYAAHLLGVARSMQTSPVLASAAVAMARRSQLEGRLVAILDSRVRRGGAGRISALAVILAAIALTAPLAALRAQSRSDSTPALRAPAVPADIDATIRAATAQRNYEMLDEPAATFEALRQFDNAKKLLDAALAIREQVSGGQSVAYGVGLMKLGDLEKKRNQPSQAVAFYSQAAQVLGDHPEAALAWMYLGQYALGNKDYQPAIDDFHKAQSLDTTQAGPAQMWMAVVCEREQKPAEADTLYQSALSWEDQKSAEAATTLELYARFLQDQGRQDDAKLISDRASAVRRTLGAQSGQAKSQAFHIGNGVNPPKLLYKVEPDYTAEARIAKYQGTVQLSVEIGMDGVARNFQVVKGLGLGLDQNAVTAVRQWQFQPGTKDGAAVPVLATIEVNFRLN